MQPVSAIALMQHAGRDGAQKAVAYEPVWMVGMSATMQAIPPKCLTGKTAYPDGRCLPGCVHYLRHDHPSGTCIKKQVKYRFMPVPLIGISVCVLQYSLHINIAAPYMPEIRRASWRDARALSTCGGMWMRQDGQDSNRNLTGGPARHRRAGLSSKGGSSLHPVQETLQAHTFGPNHNIKASWPTLTLESSSDRPPYCLIKLTRGAPTGLGPASLLA